MPNEIQSVTTSRSMTSTTCKSKVQLWAQKWPKRMPIYLWDESQLLMSVTLKPFSWLRFIDDIDMKWTHGRDSLKDF